MSDNTREDEKKHASSPEDTSDTAAHDGSQIGGHVHGPHCRHGHHQHHSHDPFVRSTPKVGRNDPCPCGSGKKYKKCCGGNQ